MYSAKMCAESSPLNCGMTGYLSQRIFIEMCSCLPNHSNIRFKHRDNNIAVELNIFDDQFDGMFELFEVI